MRFRNFGKNHPYGLPRGRPRGISDFEAASPEARARRVLRGPGVTPGSVPLGSEKAQGRAVLHETISVPGWPGTETATHLELFASTFVTMPNEATRRVAKETARTVRDLLM
jgi:hypothetical protein